MKISVCLASFNGERYISDQIFSILEQISTADELLISDDGSTDRTLNIIKSFEDPRIKLVEKPSSKNIILNFENLISAASGDVIILSDQDDIWLEGRVNIIRNYFNLSNKKFLTVCMDSCVVDEFLNVIFPSHFAHLNAGPGLCKNILKNTYVGCHMAFTSSIRDASLPFPKNIPMHDVWIGIVSEIYGDIIFDKSSPKMLFRRHDNNATKHGTSLAKKVCWRVILICNLIKITLKRKVDLLF